MVGDLLLLYLNLKIFAANPTLINSAATHLNITNSFFHSFLSLIYFIAMVDLSYIQTYIDNFQRVPLLGYPIALIKRIMISVLKTGPLPSHIGLIMDGNRRYAKSKGLKLEDGHSAGAHSLAGVCYQVLDN